MRYNAKTSWFFESYKPFSVTKKPYTVVVDLDELAITGRPAEYCYPVKFNAPAGYCDYGADPNVFLQLHQFQERGYSVMVVTTGLYPFENIRAIFQKFDVILLQENYHNRNHITGKNLLAHQKAEYIDSLPAIFNQYCILFDNTQLNQPKKRCLFYHVDPHVPFPDFNSEFEQVFSEKLFSYKKPALAIKYFSRITKTLSVNQREFVFDALESKLAGLVQKLHHMGCLSDVLNDGQFFTLCDHFFDNMPSWLKNFIDKNHIPHWRKFHARLSSFVIYKLFQLFPELSVEWSSKNISEIKLHDLICEAQKPNQSHAFFFFSSENQTKQVFITLGVSDLTLLTIPLLLDSLRNYATGLKAVTEGPVRRSR